MLYVLVALFYELPAIWSLEPRDERRSNPPSSLHPFETPVLVAHPLVLGSFQWNEYFQTDVLTRVGSG